VSIIVTEVVHGRHKSKNKVRLSSLILLKEYREDFNELDVFIALRFTATGALPAAKGTLILLMTQHADNIWNEGKFLLLFTNHRRC
jgi:hypothetical protein